MKYQKGVGLIEVIMSVLVLGLAVLGFITLQYRSLELASEALKKVEAVNLASNLAERMYVNRTKAYTNADGSITPLFLNKITLSPMLNSYLLLSGSK